jgi:hypothetical protein
MRPGPTAPDPSELRHPWNDPALTGSDPWSERRPDPLYRGPAPADWPATVAGPARPSRLARAWAFVVRAWQTGLDGLDALRDLAVPVRPLLVLAFAAVYASAEEPTRTALWAVAGCLTVLGWGRRL